MTDKGVGDFADMLKGNKSLLDIRYVYKYKECRIHFTVLVEHGYIFQQLHMSCTSIFHVYICCFL